MKYFWTRYILNYPKTLLYMLQDTEYRFSRYLEWYQRTGDFRKVMKRRQLEMTKKVKILLYVLRIGSFLIFGTIAGFVIAVFLTGNY